MDFIEVPHETNRYVNNYNSLLNSVFSIFPYEHITIWPRISKQGFQNTCGKTELKYKFIWMQKSLKIMHRVVF